VTGKPLKKGSKVIHVQGRTIVFEGLVIEGSRPGMPINCGDLLSIAGALPPRQVLDALHTPSRLGHRAHPGEIPFSGIWTEITIKPNQDGGNIDESGLSTTEDFNMAAMWILSGDGAGTGVLGLSRFPNFHMTGTTPFTGQQQMVSSFGLQKACARLR